jgi:hypothetical protein
MSKSYRTEAERATVGELIDTYLGEVTPNKKSASRARGQAD